jgi:FkbM family methyltransferase
MNLKFPKKLLQQRMSRLSRALTLASNGSSLKDFFRLFYYEGLKPTMAFRGWAHYSADRVLTFSMKAHDGSTFQTCARDNGVDVGTLADLFVRQPRTIPADLPPFEFKVFYDLGANIGAASLFFFARNPKARFYGFEPLPSNYEICALNYRNLPGSRAFPWAVGARSETTVFECQNDLRGGRLAGSPANPSLTTTGRINIRVVSVDDLVREQKLDPPDFLKIDVEGAELEVLKGVEGQLQSVKRMFIETHGPELYARTIEWLERHGFKIYQSEPDVLWADRM